MSSCVYLPENDEYSIPSEGSRIEKMEHKTEEFAKLNPFQKVPVIDDDGFVLSESVAILNYLSDKQKNSDWYPTEPQRRARVDQFNNWQHLNLRANGSMLFQTKVIIPRIRNKPPSEQDLQKWQNKWEESSEHLENVWLNRSSYLAGDRITTADLLGVCEMMQPISAGYNIDANRFPRVQDWMERVKKDTQPHFDAAHQIPMRLRSTILNEKKSQA